jgi:outer membrane protein, heavy metal efflux system
MKKLFLSLTLAGGMLPCASAQSPQSPQPLLSSQSTVSLTLAAALERAMKANPEIAAATREIQAQEGVLQQAGTRPNPELAALVEDTQKSTRTTTLQLNQTIELGGKRVARMTVADRQRDAAMIELAIKRAEIHAAVVTNFYDVLIAQERQRLALSSTELAQAATVAATKRVALGKSPPLEEAKARIAESGIRLLYAQAGSQLMNARQRLAAILGGPVSDLERVDSLLSALPALPALPTLLASVQRAPVLLRARMEVERRQALSQLERARRVSDMTLSIGVKRDEQISRNQAIFGIAIPLPLFDRNQGNLQEALSRTDKARDELAATESRLNSDLMQAYQRLNIALQETILMQKELLPGAQSAYDLALKGFEFGKFSFLDVLDAQRTLLQAKSQHLHTLTETHHAAAEIVQLTGDVALISEQAEPRLISYPIPSVISAPQF